MTDCELLEFAAKAAGVPIDLAFGLGNWVGPVSGNRFFSKWNPLTDDGDALRLAVKLEINILPTMEEASARNPSYTPWVNEDGRADPYAATRRAIVRAAAEIGKGMQ
jgi:hypothetical protein